MLTSMDRTDVNVTLIGSRMTALSGKECATQPALAVTVRLRPIASSVFLTLVMMHWDVVFAKITGTEYTARTILAHVIRNVLAAMVQQHTNATNALLIR